MIILEGEILNSLAVQISSTIFFHFSGIQHQQWAGHYNSPQRPITAAINPCVGSDALRKPIDTTWFTKASTFFNWLHWAEHNVLHTSAVKKYGKDLQSCIDARFCASSAIGDRAGSLWTRNSMQMGLSHLLFTSYHSWTNFNNLFHNFSRLFC